MTKSLAVCGYYREHQSKGGWASYLQNVLRGLHELCAVDESCQDLRVTLLHNPMYAPFRGELFENRPVSSRWGRFWTDTRFGLWDSRRFDAVLFPNYFRPPIVRAKRSVVVIHDLLYKNMPQFMLRSKRMWLNLTQRYSVHHADAVVTITGVVKQDVVRWFGEKNADKIYPVWIPIAFERLDGEAQPQINEGRPYVLGVALDRPHKNLATLVRSFARLRIRQPDLCLVLVGELRSRRPKANISAKVTEEMPATVDIVHELGLEDHVKITGFISDAELGGAVPRRGRLCTAVVIRRLRHAGRGGHGRGGPYNRFGHSRFSRGDAWQGSLPARASRRRLAVRYAGAGDRRRRTRASLARNGRRSPSEIRARDDCQTLSRDSVRQLSRSVRGPPLQPPSNSRHRSNDLIARRQNEGA